MADASLNLLAEKLWQLTAETVKLIGEAKNELTELLKDVRALQGALQDAALQKSNSNLWKEVEKNIRKLAYKAEDIIDKFEVEKRLHDGKNMFGKAFDGHYKKIKKLAKDIKDIREKVKENRRDYPDFFKLTPVINLPKDVPREPQIKFLELEAKDIVAFNKEANEVIERLVRGTEDVECIPIVGMTGIGKTTLARKVCSDSQITKEFSENIWVSVGKSKEGKSVFLVILKSSTKDLDQKEYLCEGVNELAKVIPNFVTEHRYLIVLDDVWEGELELVNVIKNVLPENKKGHRILVTTRFRDVASYASEQPYHLKFLTPEESFRLLEKKVFVNGRCRRELVELGHSIARKCGGLPLALVVIAGALKVNLSENYWKRIYSNFWQYLVKENDPTTCWKIVEASYESLSSDMKVCFLYCLAFPKGYDIPGHILISLWIAEGLIKSSPHNSFEDKAESFLMEFEKRDLVIVSREITGSIKKVKCNDIFYEFYKMEVTKEGVFQDIHDDPCINDPDVSRRLHIVSSDQLDFISKNRSADHVRSFLCFSSEDQQTNLSSPVDIQLIPKAFPLLRVLKIESINIRSFKNFERLYHLKYISISGDFKELPTFFSKFSSLQSIIINTSTSEPTLNIKANIWEMTKLMHLQTNIPAKLPLPSTQKGKSSPSSLQTLSKISPETCNTVVLRDAKNLRKLIIQGRIQDSLKTNKDGFSNFEGFQTFEKFECLENLKLMSDVPCTSVALQLPKAIFRFLLNLKKLTLSNTMFNWTEATQLGQLNCLEVLKLKIDAFTGRLWKPEEGDFRKLQVLLIHSDELQVWKASGFHFPKLRLLVLKCPRLASVPLELSQFLQSTNKTNKTYITEVKRKG